MARITMRSAESLIRKACDLEEHANRLAEADPDLAKSAEVQSLHSAAEIIGRVGRNLRDEINERS